MNINKDTIVAIFLLLFCGIMINNSFEIEDPGYQGMKASFWPTVILCLLSVMCLVMLIKSVVYKTDNNLDAIDENTTNIFFKFKNALICFFMFVLFLTFLDYLGMLIGGILFVFGLLTLLGGSSPKKLFNHFIISIITIGIMWSIFTFGLKVILPEGELLRIW
jgi:putative tricarboxylic transport membrane protein